MTTATRVGIKETFTELFQRIVSEVKISDDVIDIGAGLEAPWQVAFQKRAHRLVLLDAHQPYLDANVTRGPNVEKVCGQVPDALGRYRPSEFDVAMMIDFIEHLDAHTATMTIREAQRIARKVVVFTPDGHSPQDIDAYQMGADYWQTHRSEWSRELLERHGFVAGKMEDFHGLGQHALWGIWNRPALVGRDWRGP
jgi:hypothetical protein